MPDLSPLPRLERPDLTLRPDAFELALRAGARRAHRAVALASTLTAVLVAAIVVAPGDSGSASLAPASDAAEPARRRPIVADVHVPRGGGTEHASGAVAPAAPAHPLRVVRSSLQDRTVPRGAATPRRPARVSSSGGGFVFAADSTATTTIELSSPARIALSRPDVESSGRYAGFYLVHDDGSTRVAFLSLLRAAAAPATKWDLPYVWLANDAFAQAGDPDVRDLALPAGRYRLYVLGDRPVRIRAAVTAGSGVTARADSPAAAHFGEAVVPFAPGSTAQTARMRLPESATVGVAGAWISAPGAKIGDTLTSCVVARDASCGGEGPRSSTAWSVQDSAWGGSVFQLGEWLSDPHDLVGEGTVTAATDARIYLWSIVLDT